MDRFIAFWQTPLDRLKIPKIGPKTLQALNKAGLQTVRDCLLCLPLSFKRKIKFSSLNDLRDGDDAFFEGLIVQRSDPPLKSRRPLRVVLQTPQKETVDIVLFRYHEWTAKKIQLGKKVRVYGKIQNNAGMWQMSHPEIDEIFSLNSTFNPILEPIYSEFSEVPKNALRHLIQQLFIYYDAIKIERHDCAIKNHLKTLHGLCIPEFYPVHESLYNQAFKALAFWEAVAYFRQLTAQTSAIEQTRAFNIQSGEHTAALLARLPYKMTVSQEDVWGEIQSDLQQTKASQRLIQGDVGSGKTLLGFLAVAAAVDSGLQGVFMAPTELLAAQHFKNITTLLGDRVSIVLLTGSLSASRKKAIYEQIQTGAAQIIIGTQAVFQEKVVFAKLGVAIIDEQQRFGVAQRTYLLQKGVTDAVHCFTLTATPIPRTLSMALFGTIQLSILKEKPQGRAPITTYLTPAQKEHLVLKSIKNCVARGQSVYWICPLISESEVINASAAQQRFSILKEHPDLSDIKVGLLHGRMNASDRHDVLQAFYNGDYHVLVSTLVIEVGIDHPLATLIIIESPDRLGLSQLHQLRGRVGRSNLASYCLLLYDQNISEKGMERLTALCETDDGFKLAEMDLAIRGPGEFLGARQSGFQSLKFFSFDNNMDMIEDVLIKIKSLDQEQHRWISEFFQHNVNSDYWEHSVTQ